MGLLTLHFNEPITSDSLIVTSITIQSAKNSTEADSLYLLTGGEVLSGNVEDILIQLTSSDTNNLKLSNATKDENTTFISVPSGFVVDTAYIPNSAEAIPQSSAQQVANYTPDASPPQLLGYSINLRTESISLTFNEPVLVDFFNVSGLLLHSDAMQSGSLRRLDDGEILSTEYAAITIIVALSPQDIVSIKSNLSIATQTGNTYLRIIPGGFQDVAGVPTTTQTFIQAASVTTDTSNPALISFTLDLQSDRLQLTFNDVIDPSTFDPTGITIQSRPFRVANEYYTLTSTSMTSSTFGYEVIVDLSTDAQAIRENTNFGTQRTNTYITLLASTIDTPDGEDNAPITDGKALQAAAVIFDSDPPELQGFNLDINRGVMILTFTDFIDLDSLNLTQIVLQNAPLATPGLVYRLTGGDTILAASELTITFTSTDLNGIKAIRGLATSVGNSYLIASASTLTDLSGK